VVRAAACVAPPVLALMPSSRAERIIYPELFEQEVPGMGVCKRIQTPLKVRSRRYADADPCVF
jgi:hypothetical protein